MTKTAARSRRTSAADRAAADAQASKTTSGRRHLARRTYGATQSKDLKRVHAGLTAAAQVMSTGRGSKSPTTSSPTRTWQNSAIGYTRTVPELGSATLYVGNCLARIKLRVGRRTPDGSVEPAYENEQLNDGITEPVATAAMAIIASIRSEIGGQSELLRAFGELMFVTGELFILPEDVPTGLAFEVLSTHELAREGDHYVRYGGPGTAPEDVPDDIEPLRIWRRDLQYSRLANSSVRSCLEILEELVVLTRLVRSSAISRMALAGILAIAEEFDDPLDEEGPDGQTAESTNPLAVDIITTGAKAIDDPAAAAAWLPYLLIGPKDLIKDGINYVKFDHDDAVAVVKRREALERLAHGLDLPLEIVLGHADTTFANAAQISEDRFRVHLEPMVQMLCDALTIGILWPGLAKLQGLNPEQISEGGYPPEILAAAITYDATDLISKPDTTKSIIEAWKADGSQTAIAISELRDALSLDPAGGPKPDETDRRIANLQAIKEAAHLAPGQQAETFPPATETGGTVTGSAAAVQVAYNQLGQRIIGGAELTLERIAERIGSTCRQRAKGAQLDVLAGVSNADVPRCLGPEAVRTLLRDTDPGPAEVATFTRQVARWATDLGHHEPGRIAEIAGRLVADCCSERLYGAAPGLPPHVYAQLAAVP